MPYGKMKEKDIAEVEAFNLQLYDIKQVAALLKVTERTVMNYLKQGKIKAQKIGGKWKFTRENIERFIRGE